MQLRPVLSVLVLAALVAVTGCSRNGDPSTLSTRPGARTATVRFALTDAPAQYDQVNVVITGLAVRDAVTGEWVEVTLPGGGGTYDLLQLQNGVFATLGVTDLPAGTYDMVRLTLGDGSTIVVDGVTYPLRIPGGTNHGVLIRGTFEVPEGGSLDIGLDFDAARSIHRTGNSYMLKPRIRMAVLDETGSIAGTLDPAGDATVYAISGSDTIGTVYAAGDGTFKLAALPAGTYSVGIDVVSDAWRDTTLAGVGVTAGQQTELGTITLTAR